MPSDNVIISISQIPTRSARGSDVGSGRQAARHEAKCPNQSYTGTKTINNCEHTHTSKHRSPTSAHGQKSTKSTGSHDKTFEIPSNSTFRSPIATETSEDLRAHVEDAISGACARTIAIRDWVKLAVTRARQPAMRYLLVPTRRGHLHDRKDSRDRKVPLRYLEEDRGQRVRPRYRNIAGRGDSGNAGAVVAPGLDTISVTAKLSHQSVAFRFSNSGRARKMLSIVPLLDGGGLLETGAGGSAPK